MSRHTSISRADVEAAIRRAGDDPIPMAIFLLGWLSNRVESAEAEDILLRAMAHLAESYEPKKEASKAKIIVAIEVDGDPEQLRREIDADRLTRKSWFSPDDGLNQILIDDAYLRRSRADDSFFAFEFRGVETA